MSDSEEPQGGQNQVVNTDGDEKTIHVDASTGHVAVGSARSITIVSRDGTNTVTTFDAPQIVRGLGFTPSGKRLVFVGDNKELSLHAVPDMAHIHTTPRQSKKLVHVEPCVLGGHNPEEVFLVSDKYGDVLLIDTSDATKNTGLLGHLSFLTTFGQCKTPLGDRLVTCDKDSHIRVSHFPKVYIIERMLWGPVFPTTTVNYIPTTQRVLTGDSSGEMTFWDATVLDMKRTSTLSIAAHGERSKSDQPSILLAAHVPGIDAIAVVALNTASVAVFAAADHKAHGAIDLPSAPLCASTDGAGRVYCVLQHALPSTATHCCVVDVTAKTVSAIPQVTTVPEENTIAFMWGWEVGHIPVKRTRA